MSQLGQINCILCFKKILNFQIVVSCLLAVACAKPGLISPYAYSGYPGNFGYSYGSHVAHAPLAYSAYSGIAPIHAGVVPAHSIIAPTTYSHVIAPAVHSAVVGVEKTQYHAQDTLGQAAYGHSEAFQAHNAVQDAAGNKIGSFSYVAPNGQVLATDYVADALGYRVASNAAPVESSEIVAARAAHLHEVEVTKHRSRRSPVVAYATHPYAYSGVYGSHLGYHGISPVVARAGIYNHAHPYSAFRYY